MQTSVLHVAAELDLFKHIVDTKGPSTAEELAKKTGAATELVARLLRYLAATSYISNPGVGEYEANKTTQIYAMPQAFALLVQIFDISAPACQALPVYLSQNGYKSPSSVTGTPFQLGHNTQLSCFDYLATKPNLWDAMQSVMMMSMSDASWLNDFPLLEQEIGKINPSERPFWVDVGGGRGEKCLQLLQKYPQLHGHVVLEDLPETVSNLSPITGLKAVSQNFFEKQSVQGANFYYFRHIFHDWPDRECLSILHNLIDAMGPNSKILIDEFVLAEKDVAWAAAVADMSMMINLGGKERTEKEWKVLAQEAGLRIEQCSAYDEAGNSVLVLGKK